MPNTWSPGDLILASKINLQSSFVEDVTLATTNSNVYNNSTRTLAATITAPFSGRIEAILSVRCNVSTAGNALSDMLITGSSSGTLYSPTDAAAIQWNQTFSAGPFITQRQLTCVAGETVTVTSQHRESINLDVANFLYRSIVLQALVS